MLNKSYYKNMPAKNTLNDYNNNTNTNGYLNSLEDIPLENMIINSNLENEKDRKRTEKSFFVSKDEIVKNDYDLSINKYKEVVYKKVEYPPTSEILAEIESLNNEINKNIAELKVLLMDGKEEKSEW